MMCLILLLADSMAIFSNDAKHSRFASLGDSFYAYAPIESLADPVLASVNQQTTDFLNLDESLLNSDALVKILAGQGEQKDGIASVYSGHQFGVYNPQLGDGRAVMIGEQIAHDGTLWELQLKGSGKTPFSRFGDGKAVLRSSIREYLACEAMHALGIASTRAIALVASSTPVYREREETAACLLRSAPSHIRFGHFEYFFYTQQHTQLTQLADFVIEQYFPDIAQCDKSLRYGLWFEEVVKRTAKLIAQWQAVGFCHGVLNTDNMSILGLSIDYGPYLFLDAFKPNMITNRSDHQGRYTFRQQIPIGLWNLNALAQALSPLLSREQMQASLLLYQPLVITHYRELLLNKLGLQASDEKEDDALIGELLDILAKEAADYSYFFRQLSERDAEHCHRLADDFIDAPRFLQWLALYQLRIAQQVGGDMQRMQTMQQSNPKYVLRNYFAEQAIEKAQTGDFTYLNDLLCAVQSPFTVEERFAHFAELPPQSSENIVLSCSS